ncbi:MAG: hypothetical protein ACTHJT_05630 [Cytophaga sp.]|uniref:hypothetical protein n=1 Tax=Cytophaga sp. TaxID=29535 RepID=UPI003F821667
MVKITKENIEYFIFEYHEGNLSDTDKAEVLNFIHQHPEYENDFAHWAQSYFHTEGSVQNYGITNQLLQKDAVSWYANKWFIVSGIVFIFAMGLCSYLLTSDQKTTSAAVPSVHTTSIKESETKETSISGAGSNTNRTIQDINHASINTSEAIQSSTPAAIIENTTSSGVRMADTLQTNRDCMPVSGVQDKPKSMSKTDTINEATNVTQNNTEIKNKKTPAKNKSGISLKPENKFIPTNPDF